jgi:hypothetical protein
MKEIFTLLMLFTVFAVFGQRQTTSLLGFISLNISSPPSFLTIEGDERAIVSNNDPRFFLRINNKSNHSSSVVVMEMTSGTNSRRTLLGHHSPTYLFPGLDEYADFGQLHSRGAGLILRPRSAGFPNGIIKFMTGITRPGGSLERMRLDANGNVGIGTKMPKDPLVVASSEISYSELSIGMSRVPESGTFRRAGHHIASERDMVFNIDKPHIDNLNIGNRAYSFQTLGSSSSYTDVKSILVMNTNGNVGIGTFDLSGRTAAVQPKAKLHVSEGGVYIDDPTKGIILTSSNGSCWGVTVEDWGVLKNTYICYLS